MAFELLSNLRKRARDFLAQNDPDGLWLSLLKPKPPFNRGALVPALVSAASLVTIAILAGVTLAALIVLLLALFLITIILSKVMGVDLEILPDAAYAYR